MDPKEFAAMIAQAVKDAQTPAPASTPEPVQKALTLDDVKDLMVASFAEFNKSIDEKIAKATTFSRESATVSKATLAPEDERDADPLKYLVKKAKNHNDLDDLDKRLIGEITNRVLTDGMLYDSNDQ